ncbi:unnamed protein product [Lymnaea stagnalis]|uniref:G-patch domain-containing protein n=1 Tax=Lymnaea stagnalis TaxID=6523 RepID=A0AAV2IPB9_LYMST
MALLAEPKRKAKFGLDPRNTNWSNDDNKIGQRLMEKMGWEKGKGLGANEDGMKEHIKASYKSDSRGLGFTAKDADAWIAHQDDFNELLKTLNSQSGPEEPKEKIKEEQRPPDGQKRYRGRFARGSVQTLRSVEDLDCIFGKRKSKTNNDTEAEENKHGLTSVTSTSSVQEYFAKKMAEMKARKESSTKIDDDEVNMGRQSTSGKEALEKRVPPLYGNVMFSYDENEADKECDNPEKDSDTKLDRGWYQEWPGENKPEQESETRKKKKKRKDKNPSIDSNVIETEVWKESVESEEVVTGTTKKIKKSKKHKKENIDVVNSEEGRNIKISSSGINKYNGNDQVGELAETRGCSKSTKKSKKNKSIERDDQNSSKLIKDKDNDLVNGLGVSECDGGGGSCDMEQTDFKNSKKNKKGVLDGAESSGKQNDVQDPESTENRKKIKRKRDRSNVADGVTDANQDADSASRDLDAENVEKKKKKKDKQNQTCLEEKLFDDSTADKEAEKKKSKKRKREDSEVSDVKANCIKSAVDQKCEAGNQSVDQNVESSVITRTLGIDKKKKKLNRKKVVKEKIKKQKAAENSIFPGSNLSDINGYAMARRANHYVHIVNKPNTKKRSAKKGGSK